MTPNATRPTAHSWVAPLLAAAALCLNPTAGAAVSQTPNASLGPIPPGTVTVASGRWGKIAWTLGASEPTAKKLCTSLNENGAVYPSGCGSETIRGGLNLYSLAGIRAVGVTVAYMGGSSVPRAVVHGEVVPTARELEITFSNGQTSRTAALRPPHGLSQSFWFYAAPIPCGAYVKSILAYGSGGHLVAERGKILLQETPLSATCTQATGTGTPTTILGLPDSFGPGSAIATGVPVPGPPPTEEQCAAGWNATAPLTARRAVGALNPTGAEISIGSVSDIYRAPSLHLVTGPSARIPFVGAQEETANGLWKDGTTHNWTGSVGGPPEFAIATKIDFSVTKDGTLSSN